MGTVRTEGSRTTNLDGFKVENNAGVEAVAEMGSTMFCLIKTMNLVPEKFEYRYGKSYMYSFSSLIPNLGFWDIHPAKREANLSEWLTNALGLSYGTGYSMCAEAYANFGYLGFILFFFWGWFIANVFGKIEISAICTFPHKEPHIGSLGNCCRKIFTIEPVENSPENFLFAQTENIR